MRLRVVLAASYRINQNLEPFHDCWIPNHQSLSPVQRYPAAHKYILQTTTRDRVE
jgi:hypothetical protein